MTFSVRDTTLDVLRDLGSTTVFGNPGSTEIPFLTDLPADFRYVLGLHEGAIAGIATGYAMGTGKPALLNLHTSAGLGNAVGALSNAHAARVPLVVLVGQQDRRHIADGPFLSASGLENLLGDYAVWSTTPARPQDLPAAVARAHHEAAAGAGPAVVVAPLSDWSEPADPLATGAPRTVVLGRTVTPDQLEPLVALLEESVNPVAVIGSGAAIDGAWDEVVTLVERLGCPVWQEPFASRQGFPHDHPAYRGDLPWQRGAVRSALDGHDAILAIGASMLRGYLYDEAVPTYAAGTRLAVLTSVPEEAHRSGCDVAVLGDLASTCSTLASVLRARTPGPWQSRPAAVVDGSAELTPAAAFATLAEHLDKDAILVEESPSTRLELVEAIPATTPLSFVSNGSGWLGFGLAGAIGLRMALPDRPVVAVLGDGSAAYTVQALWTAAHYGIGALAVVVRNRRYAVMDRLAANAGGKGPWGGFPELDATALAAGFGCEAYSVSTRKELDALLKEILPGLRTRTSPLVLQLDVAG